jgi:hypothetical protein
MARAAGDSVDDQLGAQLGQGSSEVVGRAGGGGAGYEDQVGLGFGESGDEFCAGVRQVRDGRSDSTSSGNQSRQHRADRITYPTRSGWSAVHQLITCHQRSNHRPRNHRQPVKPQRRRQPQHSRLHNQPSLQQHLPSNSLFTSPSNVPARSDLPRNNLSIHRRLFVGEHGRGAGWNGSTGDYRAGLAVLQVRGRRGGGCEGADDAPGAGAGDCVAVHG